MKEKFIKYYLRIALLTSDLSHARRLKVGAVIVKEEGTMVRHLDGIIIAN